MSSRDHAAFRRASSADDDHASAPAGDEPTPRRAARSAFPAESRRRLRRSAAVLVVVAASVAAVAATRWLRSPTVAVARVVRGTAVEAVYATGTVEAVERVTVKARVAGAVIELLVKEGARVTKGEVLARIDARALRAELERANAESWAATRHAGDAAPRLAALQAQARVARAELDEAKSARDRVVRLVEGDAATPADLERAQTRVAVAEARLAANGDEQRALRIDLAARVAGSSAAAAALSARVADAEVRSPIDGVVLARTVDPGEVVSVNQPLLRVGDVTDLVLECTVDEADVGRVAVEQTTAVALYAFPQRVFRGRVKEVLPDADRAKKAFVVKVVLDEPPSGLRSGMTAEVNVVVGERAGALLVPAEALDAAGNAWVVTDGRAVHRAMRVGIRDLARVEVVEGVAEGDLVVVNGSEGLRDGSRVRASVQPFDPEPSAAGARGHR
jgi:HlyD family secretion protein